MRQRFRLRLISTQGSYGICLQLPWIRPPPSDSVSIIRKSCVLVCMKSMISSHFAYMKLLQSSAFAKLAGCSLRLFSPNSQGTWHTFDLQSLLQMIPRTCRGTALIRSWLRCTNYLPYLPAAFLLGASTASLSMPVGS